MGEKKWYRVVDPLNPLFGCDVTGEVTALGMGEEWLTVVGMRRVDVFVGDRPFQLFAGPDAHLGILVQARHLEDSPLQDETVELSTDRPFGRCVDESEMTRRDGLTLRVARYERAVQIAVEDADDGLLASETFGDPDRKIEQRIVDAWASGTDADDLVTVLRMTGRD